MSVSSVTCLQCEQENNQFDTNCRRCRAPMGTVGDVSSVNCRDPEPQPATDVEPMVSVYNGRRFYGTGASDRAELTYLRDWKAWAERQLRSLHAFERSVNEALNSGDGSYRP